MNILRDRAHSVNLRLSKQGGGDFTLRDRTAKTKLNTSPFIVTFAPCIAKQSCVDDLTKICRLRHGSIPTRKLVFLEITN